MMPKCGNMKSYDGLSFFTGAFITITNAHKRFRTSLGQILNCYFYLVMSLNCGFRKKYNFFFLNCQNESFLGINYYDEKETILM